MTTTREDILRAVELLGAPAVNGSWGVIDTLGGWRMALSLAGEPVLAELKEAVRTQHGEALRLLERVFDPTVPWEEQHQPAEPANRGDDEDEDDLVEEGEDDDDPDEGGENEG